jgi:hypothetical protein
MGRDVVDLGIPCVRVDDTSRRSTYDADEDTGLIEPNDGRRAGGPVHFDKHDPTISRTADEPALTRNHWAIMPSDDERGCLVG